MKSRGKLILFADADGATRFSDFERLEKALKDKCTSLDVRNRGRCIGVSSFFFSSYMYFRIRRFIFVLP